MDAPQETDRDVEVQRNSADTIAAIDNALNRILYSRKTESVHSLVRRRAVEPTVRLIDYFQEWPQLLDRKLRSFVQLLSDSFLEYLSNHQHQQSYLQDSRRHNEEITPLPSAVCQILYTFCKVRGQKVIVQLLNNEAHNLELMFNTLLLWNPLILKTHSQASSVEAKGGSSDENACTWQERYVMLLWLSHLLLIPNDLTNVFPEDFRVDPTLPTLPISLPPALPQVAKYIIRVCTYFLDKAGPERGPAAKLLLRLTLRTDMRRLNLDQDVVPWAIHLVQGGRVTRTDEMFSIHSGFSLLDDFLKMADDKTLNRNIQSIGHFAQVLSDDEERQSELLAVGSIGGLAVKFYRELGSVLYRLRPPDWEDLLQTVIGFLLTRLADDNTAVRFKASKALGVVASQIESDMAEQILEQVLVDVGDAEAQTTSSDAEVDAAEQHKASATSPELDFQSANASLWHGNILAIAHMLFRRTIPATAIPEVASVLSRALNFNQHNLHGARVGENVRDAAIFAVWALSRKYKTNETFACDNSFMQDLALELVCLACFDPAGNIRRGASAALQEMVGRHQGKISKGLELVRIVDYYAVASRANAMLRVALEVLQLFKDGDTSLLLFLCLKGWRGLGSTDLADRRLAAESIGYLSVTSLHIFDGFLSHREDAFIAATGNNVLRNSLTMALAAMLDIAHEVMHRHGDVEIDPRVQGLVMRNQMVKDGNETMIHAKGFSVMEWQFLRDAVNTLSERDNSLSNKADAEDSREVLCLLTSSFVSIAGCRQEVLLIKIPHPTNEDIEVLLRQIQNWLSSPSPDVLKACSQAIYHLLRIAPPSLTKTAVHDWSLYLRPTNYPQLHKTIGIVHTIGLTFHLFKTDHHQDGTDLTSCRRDLLHLIIRFLADPSVDIRCAALEAAAQGPIPAHSIDISLASAIENCLLDDTLDYQNRDIGSAVRLAAVPAAELLLQTLTSTTASSDPLVQVPGFEQRQRLILLLCALATEYYDKIRLEATASLLRNWDAFGLSSYTYPSPSHPATFSPSHFSLFLSIASHHPTSTAILTSFITSATSTASLSSPALDALAQHVSLSQENLHTILNGLYTLLDPKILDTKKVQALCVLKFLADIGYLNQVQWHNPHSPSTISFSSRNLISRINRLHYQSRDARRLEAAVAVYAAFSSAFSTVTSAASTARGRVGGNTGGVEGGSRGGRGNTRGGGENTRGGRENTRGGRENTRGGRVNTIGGSGNIAFATDAALKEIVVGKLVAMLSHPVAKVRSCAADRVFIVTGDVGMLGVEWGGEGGKRAREEGERVRGVLMGL